MSLFVLVLIGKKNGESDFEAYDAWIEFDFFYFGVHLIKGKVNTYNPL